SVPCCTCRCSSRGGIAGDHVWLGSGIDPQGSYLGFPHCRGPGKLSSTPWEIEDQRHLQGHFWGGVVHSQPHRKLLFPPPKNHHGKAGLKSRLAIFREPRTKR